MLLTVIIWSVKETTLVPETLASFSWARSFYQCMNDMCLFYSYLSHCVILYSIQMKHSSQK